MLRCNPRALREGYLAALAAYLEEVRRGCSQNAIDYVLLRTSQPLDVALSAYLSNRMARTLRTPGYTRPCKIVEYAVIVVTYDTVVSIEFLVHFCISF
jgi:TctA family transporter